MSLAEFIKIFVQSNMGWLVAATLIGGSICTIKQRHRPKMFWKAVDLVWLSMFVATIATSLIVLEERADRQERIEAESLLDAGSKVVLGDLYRSIMPECETVSDDWREFCAKAAKIELKSLTELDEPAHAYLQRSREGEKGNPKFNPDAAVSIELSNNSIYQVVSAYRQQVGLTSISLVADNEIADFLFGSSVQHAYASVATPLDSIMFKIYFERSSERDKTLQMLPDLPEFNDLSLMKFTLFSAKLVSIWRMQESVMRLGSTTLDSLIHIVQSFALLVTCLVFPFRVGKSIYEILEVKKSPQPEQLRAKRRGGLSLVRKVSRYRSSRW